jgi:hypothetical protein
MRRNFLVELQELETGEGESVVGAEDVSGVRVDMEEFF